MVARRPLVAIGGQLQELPSADSVFGAITSPEITSVVRLTQAAYNALSPPDPNTLYLIEGNSSLVGITVGTVAPSSPSIGQLWVDTN